LFDGEGMVRINRQKLGSTHVRYAVFAFLGMTDPRPIRSLVKELGGHLSINHHERRNSNHRPQYCWTVSSKRAVAFLKQIRPYCLVKGEEIDIALRLQSNIDKWRFKLGNQHKTHPERNAVMAEREKMFHEITKLKHRSHN
jgi:hypothetical protein